MTNVTTLTNDIEKIWRIIEKINICMLITVHNNEISARPMATTVRREHNVLRC